MSMTEIEAAKYELELLKRLRDTDYEKVEIVKRVADYVLHDKWLKENRLR